MKALTTYIAALMAFTAVVTSNGWHLPVIQGIAWVNMYGDYRESMSAEEALDAAIGGEALCNLCKYVQSSNPSQEEQSRYRQSEKSNLLITGTTKTPLLRPQPRAIHRTDYYLDFRLRWEEMDTPPPKRELV